MDSLSPRDPSSNHKQFYVYALSYPESMGGRVFYIGKGSGKRIHKHEEQARGSKQENPYKCNTINAIWSNGEQVVRSILSSFADEQEAFMYERALIFFMDNLTNMNDGGTGQSNPHEDTRRKMSEARKHVIHSESTRQKYRERMKGNTYNKGRAFSEETRRNMGHAHRGKHYGGGKPLPDEQKQKMSESLKGRKKPEGHGQAVSEALKGHAVSDETRKKISESNKGHTLSQEHRDKIRENNRRRVYPRGHTLPEETKKKMSIAQTGRVHSEETKQKMRESALLRADRKRGG